MKNTIITAAVSVVVAIGLFLGGQATAPKSVVQNLGSYNPPTQSTSGFSQSISTSTTLSPICLPTNIQFLGSSALVTSTFSAATTTYAACPNLANAGASISGFFTNDSTNTVAFAMGTGDVVKCETNGVGTSTVTGSCIASAFSVLASTTINYSMFFDTASTTEIILVGNNYK